MCLCRLFDQVEGGSTRRHVVPSLNLQWARSLGASIAVCALQVCTYDLWDRHTTEGYGWVQLGPNTSSGSCTHYVDTWKPLGEPEAVFGHCAACVV